MFSVLMVELTLGYNHATAVLGGPDDNELHLPSELLPLMIGAFSFLRTCWLKFEEWRSPSNPDPSIAVDDDGDDDLPARARRSRTMRLGVRVFQAFSESLAADAGRRAEHEAEELDRLERGRPTPERYLVAWLPWLSLLKRWRNDAARADECLPMVGAKGRPAPGAKEVEEERVAKEKLVGDDEAAGSEKAPVAGAAGS
jgi:hypothetical protein